MKKSGRLKLLKKVTGKRAIGSLICVLALCCGLFTVANIKETSVLTQSQNEISEHDGDVLVDSAQVAENTDGDTSSKGADEKNGNNDSLNTVTNDTEDEKSNADSYFREKRATVDMDRNEVLSMLTDTIESSESESEKAGATEQKLKIVKYMEQEKNIEHNISAKGLPQCLVLISDNSVNITVDKKNLKEQDVARICEVAVRETGRDVNQIVIQSRY